jgi:6-phosphogluconolactonase
MAAFHVFSGPDELAEIAAMRVAQAVGQGLAEGGAAALVVPGGRTPEGFLTRLGSRPLDWARVAVTLCDERWVDEESADSNAAMVRRTLLAGGASAARFIPLYNGAPTPEEGRPDAEARLAELPRPWAAVVLGMGDDGHFASLFPGEPSLAVGLDPDSPRRCVAARGPCGGPPRLSLTLSCLAGARQIFVIATGARKRQVWQSAVTTAPVELPVAALHRLTATPVEFLWCP